MYEVLRLLTYWLPHILGIDTQQSWFYDFWSGFAASGAAWLAIIFAYYTLRIELKALKLETQLLSYELEKAREESPSSSTSTRSPRPEPGAQGDAERSDA